MATNQKVKQPLQIKARISLVSPTKQPSRRSSPSPKPKLSRLPDSIPQPTNPSPSVFLSPPQKQNFYPAPRFSATQQTFVRRSPSHYGPIIVNNPNAVLMTTLPARDLEMLHLRLQAAEARVFELSQIQGKGKTGEGEHGDKDRLEELRRKVVGCLGFVREEGDGVCRDDPYFLLEKTQKKFDELSTLRNSEQSAFRQEVSKLTKQQLPGESDKVQSSIIFKVNENHTVPLEQQRNQLITWKANLQAYYKTELKQQQQKHQKQLCELQSKLNNELIDLQKDIKELHGKRCSNCDGFKKTISTLNEQLTNLK